MAPSANRRPGNSRRAQYSTFFGYMAGVLGALVGAVFLTLSILGPNSFSALRNTAAAATEPGAVATAATRNAGSNLFATLSGYLRAGSENERLRRELAQAKVRLAEARGTADENRRLKALLNLRETDPSPVTVTQLTSSTASSPRRFATIAAGSSQGVETGMPVRSELGLIGRVLEVGHTTARVLLVTDGESIVPVRRARDGLPAFAQGRGDGSLKIRLINLGVNPIRKGDVFVTSGSGGLYRPGTAIGVITGLVSDGGVARVLSDPAATEYVVVERTWAQPAATAPAASPVPQP